jgi:dipeptidyl aminopeptidase/acylaminoacyl peptidase
LLDLAHGTLATVDQPAVTIAGICAFGSGAAWLGSMPTGGPAIWSVDDPTASPTRAAVRMVVGPPGASRGRSGPGDSDDDAAGSGGDPISKSGPGSFTDDDVSVGRPFSFVNRRGQTVHGLLFAPTLQGVVGPGGDLPPLVLQCHGGPTGSAEAGFDVVVQYLTTRGFAVAAVDYGGSTGYGRAYRDRLRTAWGVLDVEDCADGARSLADRSLVDGSRMAIRGSSAGGLTALAALARSRCFAAAVSWYGVTDLRALAVSTHDFEAHYTDWLIGPLPGAAAEYDERSPKALVDHMRGAVLLLQGTDDPVVPVEQAESMAASLRARGVRCELLTFEGESHGFRRSETIERCLQAEHAFYLDVLFGPG